MRSEKGLDVVIEPKIDKFDSVKLGLVVESSEIFSAYSKEFLDFCIRNSWGLSDLIVRNISWSFLKKVAFAILPYEDIKEILLKEKIMERFWEYFQETMKEIAEENEEYIFKLIAGRIYASIDIKGNDEILEVVCSIREAYYISGIEIDVTSIYKDGRDMIIGLSIAYYPRVYEESLVYDEHLVIPIEKFPYEFKWTFNIREIANRLAWKIFEMGEYIIIYPEREKITISRIIHEVRSRKWINIYRDTIDIFVAYGHTR